MPGPDLHLHSTFSDGLLTPEEIVSRAVSLHLPAIAIADHDSVGAIDPARIAAAGTGLDVISAVELSAEVEGRTVHILGYHVDHHDSVLLTRLAALRDGRRERADRILRALAGDGIAIELDPTLSGADGAAVGRAHIARELVRTGHAHDMGDAFARYVGDDAPYFTAKSLVTPEQAIQWVTEAGGVPILAHPGLSNVDDLIQDLVHSGLAGIEACHASHDAPTAARYQTLAAEFGLIVTGGSDYHGSASREGGAMGCACAPEGALEALAAAASRQKGSR